MTNIAITEQEYQDFCKYLEAKCGIVLGESKQYLVRSRLGPLLTRNKIGSMSELLQLVVSGRNRDLAVEAIDAMTTNETLWFRDFYPFEILSNTIIPEVSRRGKQLKIWSAASSSGQEPYSIAMAIQELALKRPGLVSDANITATDISSDMLNRCRLGVYDNLALSRGLSEARKKQFFDDAGDGKMKIKDQTKRLINFRQQNLLDNYKLLGKFDIIFCRNVLIYFSPAMKSDVLNRMADSLNPGGYLFLGASESLTGLTDRFDMIRCNPGIVYKLK
ncbi:chemotaxis protein CheR [Veronia nyctiphanis]|uniref:protein-glutamate O-methyltransferase n=1 Tax=Veronia nyctiphanis TaxID=1278244 RepID=A0A4Q0YRZ7_9GAMM|nr:protein-glutamate O-methyltransferase [Veronia nyctiphanis]RXJ72894.1 chemotaxis protein CheR [Veronia nyctiphanis]